MNEWMNEWMHAWKDDWLTDLLIDELFHYGMEIRNVPYKQRIWSSSLNRIVMGYSELSK